MTVHTITELRQKHCVSCEGGVPKLTPQQAQEQAGKLLGWSVTSDHLRIRKTWVVKNFMAGVEFFQRVAEVAEAEGHHPDLHLEGYRNVAIEIWTHAIDGLSENDFILAAKIDELPVERKG